jgi:guanylate kinase
MKDRQKGIIFIVSAPSGAGKTTLCAELSQRVPNLSRSISHTTRAPRPGERHGVDYCFVTDEKFDEMVEKNEFLEWADVHGHRYGTGRDRVMELVNQGQDILLNIDCQGAMHLKKKGVDGVFIYVLPPSLEALKARLLERKSDPPEEVARRLRKAREEVWSYREYYYLIVNDQVEQALAELEAIVLAERRKMKRMNLGWIEETFIKAKPDSAMGEVS